VTPDITRRLAIVSYETPATETVHQHVYGGPAVLPFHVSVSHNTLCRQQTPSYLRAELRNEVKVCGVLPPWVGTELARGLGRTGMPGARVAGGIVRARRRDQFEV
jgi:hypothetical protein